MCFYKRLEEVLKREPNFVSDNGELKKWVILQRAQNYDTELIELLFSDAVLKDRLFVNVKETLIFKQNEFIDFLEQKNYLNDSYTRYKNKVGLTINGKYLNQCNETILVWPFKDCILEGGQSREEDKREEIFFNEVLAQDEITQLLDPKVLTNVKRIDKDGEKPFDTFNRNEHGTITDNLIIKGNNLLALHTLEKEFAGKVKLIYIDPPYNTGSDSFGYNDSFNHSSWLTFMKNRLEAAKTLLREDGIIFISIDNNEFAKLHVLMSEVFGYENLLTTLIWLNKEGGGKSDSKHFRQKHEYILCSAKNKRYVVIYPKAVEDIDRYKFEDKYVETRGKYQLIKLDSGSLSWGKSMDYPIEFQGKVYYAGSDKKKWEERQQGKASKKDWSWRWSKDKYQWGLENDFIVFKNGNIYTKQYLNCDENGNIENRMIQPTGVLERYSNTQSNKHMKQLFERVPFNYSKPEGLLFELLSYTTNENDIVLDFYLGSGTTATVAHKMHRQYIGVEQMDYIKTVSTERLKKVIEGEQGGISKSVNWKGGGDFVYLELKKYNQTFIEQIEAAKNTETLLHIWQNMKAKSFLNYNVDIKKQDEHLDEFKTLTLAEQKRHLCEILDKNQLYVNLSSLNDSDFACTENEKKITKDFYGIEE